MKKISVIIVIASAIGLISFTVTSNTGQEEQQSNETAEVLFEPRGGYALEDR